MTHVPWPRFNCYTTFAHTYHWKVLCSKDCYTTACKEQAMPLNYFGDHRSDFSVCTALVVLRFSHWKPPSHVVDQITVCVPNKLASKYTTLEDFFGWKHNVQYLQFSMVRNLKHQYFLTINITIIYFKESAAAWVWNNRIRLRAKWQEKCRCPLCISNETLMTFS